jgi:hypothetical protein
MSASEPRRRHEKRSPPVRGRLKSAWRTFHEWRRRRPFGAGSFLLPAGVAIGLPPYASFRLGDLVLSISTIGGVSAVLIAALLAISAVSLWFRPQYRMAAGVMAILVSLVALVTTNLGGFLIGTVLGLVGGALAISWTPPARPATDEPDRGGVGRSPSRFRSAGTVILFFGALATVSASSATAEHKPQGVQPFLTASADTRGLTSGRVWVLTASQLRLSGLQYLGIGTTKVGDTTVEVLRFTARRIDIADLEQTSELLDGHTSTITAPPRSTSTATGNPVELLTLRLTGNLSLLGLVGIPVDFTPAHPPPLVLPDITLTDVTTINTDLTHARLTVPGAKITIT